MMNPPQMPPALERLSEVGPLTGILQTLLDVIRAPILFFERLSPTGPVLRVILFWMLTTLPPLGWAGLHTYEFLQETLALTMTAPMPVQFTVPWWLFVIVAPLLHFVSLLSGVAGVHLLLQIMGHARGGWRGTFRACGYASAPAVLGFVPYVGAPIGGIWMGLLQFIALRRIHNVSFGMLLLAYLLPVLVVIIFAVGLVVVILALVGPNLSAII